MDRSYWEKIAPEYNTEIFDVLKNDRKGIIVSAIRKFSSKKRNVIDIGCAIGKWLPVLSPLFKKVYAVDISSENLSIAQQLYASLKNIEYNRVDMSASGAELMQCDFAICINAILTGSLRQREAFFNNLKKCVKKNGHIVLVVPCLESYMLTSVIRQRWDPDNDARSVIPKNKADALLKNILHGNVEIDGMLHKHYLKEELQLLLSHAGFAVKEFHKIEYEWNTEFLKPPKWLKDPKPWDWMVLAKRNN